MVLDVSLPKLFVGTSHLGSVMPLGTSFHRETFRYLDSLVDMGLWAFDLAASYQAGGTERLFGQWLRQRGTSLRIFLTTKGGHPIPVVAPRRLGAKALRSDLEASLRRLGREQIDLYFLHRDDGVTPLEEIAGTLGEFMQSGKIAAFGLSNWHYSRIEALTRICDALGVSRPVASSPQWSLFEWTRPAWPGCVSLGGDLEGQQYHRLEGLWVLAWSPLAGGYIRQKDALRGVYGSEQSELRRARLFEWASSRNLSPEVGALAYLLAQPLCVRPIVASRSVERMRDNLRAVEVPLSDEEVRFLTGPLPEEKR